MCNKQLLKPAKMPVFRKLLVFLLSLIVVNSLDVVVKTKNGSIRGRKAQTVGQKLTYFAYQGIPYAEPPTENLRFEPPVSKKNWTGVINTTKDGNMCVQGYFPIVNGNEDCLFINVYVPGVSNNGQFPVMVFIHGGGFQFGSGNYDAFGPDYLLEKEVIVVTLNYRLGIFGFLSTGDSTFPGNNGLKDQVLALQWVRDNIAIFGGNPSQVTIFGQSAGSASVSYQIHSPLSKGLFHGAIMESGVSICSWALSRYVPEMVRAVGQVLGISDNTEKGLHDTVNRLKKIKNSRDVLKLTLIPEIGLYAIFDDPRYGFAYGPVIEPQHENAFFTKKAHQALVEGDFTKVPVIVGFNSLEGTFDFGLLKLYMLKYDANHTRLLPPDLNVKENLKKQAGEKIKEFYFENNLIAASPDVKLMQYLSDDQFVRPTREFVHQVHKHSSVYFYVFSYEGKLGSPNRHTPGVAHGEEINYLFRSKSKSSSRDRVTRERMTSMWTNFAKTGNPTPPEYSNTSGITWQKSDDNYTYLDIGHNVILKQFPEKTNMTFWDRFFEDYANPPLSTY